MNIVQRMKAYDKEALVDDTALIDKTLSTFPIGYANLSIQYRNLDFDIYEALLTKLLTDERQQTIILANSQKGPAGSNSLSSSSFTPQTKSSEANFHEKSKDDTRKGGKNRRESNFRGRNTLMKRQPNKSWKSNRNTKCYKCGCNGHTASDCRTA